ncbi:hypothetical protein AB0K43_01400 [Kitasatospora sp. NPDC049258]|uniref:hypothetical protein n=1 Tax=Kitasatospora sp. NPDC049258 TaxID=3155394 RepID=UPI00343BCB34
MALLMLLSGCGSSGSAGSAERLGTPAASVPTGNGVIPSGGSGAESVVPTDGPEGAVGDTVLSTYQHWWDAKVEAYGRSDSDGAQLGAYSSGQALSDSVAGLHQLHEANLVMVGAPRTSPVVKNLDLRADPQTAVVEDCLDVSEWHQADPATHALEDPAQRLSRYVSTTKLRKSSAGWLIVETSREVGRTC